MLNHRKKFLTTVGTAVVERGMALGPYLPGTSEMDQLTVEHVLIPLKDLGSAFDGFRIVLMSDFHLYPITQVELVEEAVQMANDLNPDLIVLTGDYVWWEAEAVWDLAPVLAKLNARYGVFAIMGNHDLWTDADQIETAFARVGIPFLINQGVPITIAGQDLYLAGIDDGWSGQPDLNAALSDRLGDAPVVLLAHEPDLADEFSQDGRIALQLSGHTHGGQVRLPSIGALTLPYLGKKYDHGLYQVQDLWVYTNRGIGATLLPARINCPPEITELTLVRL